MKLYIQSPVFQKFLFNNQRKQQNTSTNSTIQVNDQQSSMSRSLTIKQNHNSSQSRRRQVQQEQRGLSLSISRETNRNFFKDCVPQNKSVQEQFQTMLREIQVGNSLQVITKLEQGPFSKKTYLILGIAYKQLNQFDKSRHWLNKCTKEFPNYIDGYIQSAILEFKAQKFHDSIKYTDQALLLNPTDRQASLYKARCHSALKQHQNALEIYEKIKDLDFIGKSRYCFTLIKCNQLDQALIKLDQLLLQDSENAEALLLKGVILFKKNKYLESELLIEQSIQLSQSHQLTAKAISYIVKSKIQIRDFYEAALHLKRADLLKKNYKPILKLTLFVQGAVKLMKRQYQKAYELISAIKHVSKFLQPIYPKFLAYSQFCISDFNGALNSYQMMQNLDEGSKYNQYLSQSLLQIKNGQFNQAKELLDKSIKIFPNRLEPYFYKGCICLLDKLFEGEKECSYYIDLAFEKQGKQPNLYFARALLKSFNRRFTSALKDLEKAIDKSEDSISDHFYIRGILYAQNMRLKEAIKDLSTAIHFNRENADAYLERAKCYQIKGEAAQSFNDMNKYVKFCNNTDDIHYWSGSLLFHNNAYDEALKAFCEAKQTSEILVLKLKCEIKLQHIDKSLFTSNLIIQSNPQEQAFKVDQQMLQYIKQITDILNEKKQIEKCEDQLKFPIVNGEQGYIFQNQDILLLKSSSLIYLKRYTEALTILTKLECYWLQFQNDRLNSLSSHQDIDSLKSEAISNEMVLKPERIVQHIIGIKFNITLIYLIVFFLVKILQQLFQYPNAKRKLEDIREQIGNVQSEELDYLQQITQNQIDKKNSSTFSKPILTFLMNEKSIFHQFPQLKIQLFGNNQFECRLSLNFPDIQPPNICPQFKKEFIFMIKPTLIENKPEAPWLQRQSNQSLIFTQNQLSDDIDFTTDEEIDSGEVKKKKRIAQNLEIDEKVQKRLDQLMKKL